MCFGQEGNGLDLSEPSKCMLGTRFGFTCYAFWLHSSLYILGTNDNRKMFKGQQVKGEPRVIIVTHVIACGVSLVQGAQSIGLC